jgi:hypothetical protein
VRIGVQIFHVIRSESAGIRAYFKDYDRVSGGKYVVKTCAGMILYFLIDLIPELGFL